MSNSVIGYFLCMRNVRTKLYDPVVLVVGTGLAYFIQDLSIGEILDAAFKGGKRDHLANDFANDEALWLSYPSGEFFNFNMTVKKTVPYALYDYCKNSIGKIPQTDTVALQAIVVAKNCQPKKVVATPEDNSKTVELGIYVEGEDATKLNYKGNWVGTIKGISLEDISYGIFQSGAESVCTFPARCILVNLADNKNYSLGFDGKLFALPSEDQPLHSFYALQYLKDRPVFETPAIRARKENLKPASPEKAKIYLIDGAEVSKEAYDLHLARAEVREAKVMSKEQIEQVLGYPIIIKG